MRARALIVAATLLWSALAAAVPATPAAIDLLMHKSGIWQQLAAMSAQFEQGVDQGTTQQGIQDERITASLREAYKVACSPDRLRSALAKTLAADLSAEEVDAALAWLGTDLGARITRLEEEASSRAPPERALELVAALPAERRELYLRLARAIHAGEVGAATLINMSYGLARGIRIAAPGTQDPEEIREALQANRPRIVTMIRQQFLGAAVVTYATLSDAEVERYVAFVESPAGRRYQAATASALDRALTDASVEAGRLLMTTKST